MALLEVGVKAPNFKGINQNEETVSLSDFKDKIVVLYFYPKDDTPGCTAEACNFRDNYQLLMDKGIQVIGVSPDKPKKHTKFIERHDLPFPLIADVDKEIITAFGAWGRKKFMGREYDGVLRSTFVINRKGIIEHVISKVKTKQSTEQLLELMNL